MPRCGENSDKERTPSTVTLPECLLGPGRYHLPRLLAVAAHLPRLRSEALEVAVAVKGEMVHARQPEQEEAAVVGAEVQTKPALEEMVVVLWRQTPCTPTVLVGNP